MIKIKRVACAQFAGLKQKEWVFSEGLNLMVGKNESGKSTLIDLIFHLFFKDVKLDGRRDAAFFATYFPKSISGPQGNVIDGSIEFETKEGIYRLRKEWERGEGRCALTLPGGTILKGSGPVGSALGEVLTYRAGVYSELIFPSQKRSQYAVESILRSLGKRDINQLETKSDLLSALTHVSMETGGVSLETIKQQLLGKLEALGGRWDFGADAPEGGPKRASWENAWDKGAGSIVKAYYEADRIRSALRTARDLERRCAEERQLVNLSKQRQNELQEEHIAFLKCRDMIEQRGLLLQLADQQKKTRREVSDALQSWPNCRRNLCTARELLALRGQVRVRENYRTAASLWEALQERRRAILGLSPIREEDVKTFWDLTKQERMLDQTLAGMQVSVRINALGDVSPQVREKISGVPVRPEEGLYEIDRATVISVPGVLEMELMPRGVDARSVQEKLTGVQERITRLRETYAVQEPEQLEAQLSSYQKTAQEMAALQEELKKILGNTAFSDLKKEARELPADLPAREALEECIRALCGDRGLEAVLGGLEARDQDFQRKYDSLSGLAQQLETLDQQILKTEEKLKLLERIPKRYAHLQNPQTYEEELERQIAQTQLRGRQHEDRLRAAERALGETSAEEYEARLSEKEALLSELKETYGHWHEIWQTYQRLRKQQEEHPARDVAERFSACLSVITAGQVGLGEMDEQLLARLHSGSNALTYEILSEGTRETIALAFRLAMLGSLFPQGGMFAVFDDPFTQMDPGRVRQACDLITRFAQNHQVLFVTCDEKYRNMMQGNEICI